MKKYLYKYLIVLVILIALIIYVISLRYDILAQMTIQTQNNIFNSNWDNVIEISDEIEVTEIKPTGKGYPLNNRYMVGQEHANLYSLSYEKNNLKVGDKLKYSSCVSDQLYLLFRESYPNISIADMGLDSEEEAYQAVQLAIWELGSRTGEARYGSELSRINSIRADLGTKDISSKVYEKAKQLVKFVEEFSYSDDNSGLTLLPTLIIRTLDVKRELIDINDGYLIGPYKYRVETGLVADMNVTISDDKNGTETVAKIVDSKGKEIKDYKETDEVYVVIPAGYSGKIELTFKTRAKKLSPSIYTAYDTDYIANAYEIVEMEESVWINITED